MSSTPFGLGFGARFIMDAHQSWTGEGLPVYLRTQNADDSSQGYADLGFQVTVTGNSVSGAGTTDTQIFPQPTVEQLNLHEIGIMGTQLQFGATRFIISHTWVSNWMSSKGYQNPYSVFRDPTIVVGIYYDGQLYRIEEITHTDLGGVILYWNIVCNAPQSNVTG